MKLGRLIALIFLGVATVGGCAYYNGLYNANQLVKDALRAEREGRIGEARSLWSRAAVKAESVAVRYSDSKYFDDALVLQGRALRAAGQCRAAIEPLQAAIEHGQDPALLEQAHFFLGRCRYAEGQVDSAIVSFTRTLPSDDTLLASEAYLWRGRAFAERGQLDSAIADFRISALVDAAFDLSVASARLRQDAEAERVLRWRADGEYLEDLWLATLDSVGEYLPDLSSAITELLLERQNLDESETGNLLLRDGEMWAEHGEKERATERFFQVVDVAPDLPAGSAARFRLIVSELQSTTDLSRLPGWSDSLAGIAEYGEIALPSSAEISRAVEMAAFSLQDHASDDLPADDWRLQNPDLEMFLAAEALRDGALAKPLAAALFQEIVFRYPSSPVAPKAMLAAAALDGDAADSLTATAGRMYPQSPYTLVLRGVALDAYAAIEDSLRTLILARRGAI